MVDWLMAHVVPMNLLAFASVMSRLLVRVGEEMKTLRKHPVRETIGTSAFPPSPQACASSCRRRAGISDSSVGFEVVCVRVELGFCIVHTFPNPSFSAIFCLPVFRFRL